MKKALIAAICGIAIIGGGFAVYNVTNSTDDVYTAPQVKQTEQKEPTTQELLKLVNQERAKQGVNRLRIDTRLNTSAQKKANDMLEFNYYAHESDKSPNNRGDSSYWIFDTGIKCVSSSENLDEHSSAKGAVSAWVGSVSHRKAMTNNKYDLTGFGISDKNENGYYYIVEHFCQTP